MRKISQRIPPILPAAFSDAQKKLAGGWDTLNFTRVIVQHPELYGAFIPFLDKLIRGSNLPPRDREVLIIRALAVCEEVYEAEHHDSIAHNAGMSEAEIAAAKTDGKGLSAFERVLMRATDELIRDRCVGDATWGELAQRYSQIQLMEVVFLVGAYVLMAMATLSLGIPLEQDADTAEQLTKLRQYK